MREWANGELEMHEGTTFSSRIVLSKQASHSLRKRTRHSEWSYFTRSSLFGRTGLPIEREGFRVWVCSLGDRIVFFFLSLVCVRAKDSVSCSRLLHGSWVRASFCLSLIRCYPAPPLLLPFLSPLYRGESACDAVFDDFYRGLQRERNRSSVS